MKRISLVIIFMLTLSFVTTYGQTSVSPEKMTAIKELLALVNSENDSEMFIKVMFAQQDLMEKDIVKSILDERTDLTADERLQLEKQLVDDMTATKKKFRDRLLEKLDFNKMMDEIMVSVYDKFYTLEEINDLTAFYRTPTGQKMLKTMQPLMIETMSQSQEKIVPKLMEVMAEINAEQKKELAKKAEEIKPRRKRMVSKQ